MEISALSDVVAHLYSKIAQRSQDILNEESMNIFAFNGYIPVKEGFLFAALEKEPEEEDPEEYAYHVYGDYAYGTFDEEIFHVTFNMISGFYPGPDEEDRSPPPVFLNDQVMNIARIANYGLEKLTNDIRKDLTNEGDILVDDIYRIQIKKILSEFGEPNFVFDDELSEVNIFGAYRWSVVLKIHLVLDIIDERAYKIGGSKYLKGAERFDERKGKK